MREKNYQTRQEIMKAAYACFSERDYKDVYLKDIAEKAGITKTLLQYYYPQKHVLISEMMGELLVRSFSFIAQSAEAENANIHVELAVYTTLLWLAGEEDAKFGRFLGNAFKTQEVFDFVMERVYEWLRELLLTNNVPADLKTLRIALEFSVAGGMHLYFRRDVLNLTVQQIMREISITFMRMMGCAAEERYENIKEAEKRIENTDISEFVTWCRNSLD